MRPPTTLYLLHVLLPVAALASQVLLLRGPIAVAAALCVPAVAFLIAGR